MPAGTIHMGVAKKYMEKHPRNNEHLFLVGNVCPDSWRNSGIYLTREFRRNKSHYSNCGRTEYKSFYKLYKDQLDDDLIMGYLVHLMTDRFWYGNNLSTVHEKETSDEYHIEFPKLATRLMKELDVSLLKELDKDYEFPVKDQLEILDVNGINETIKFLNKTNSVDVDDSEELFISVEDVIKDIDKTVEFIENELEVLKRECL